MSLPRISTQTKDPEVTLYQIQGGEKYDREVGPLIERCKDAASRIQSGSKDMGKGIGWVRSEPVNPADRTTFLEMREEFARRAEAGGRGGKNILKKAQKDDTMIGNGKDSNVFEYLGENGKYIYKESAQEGTLQEAKPENIIYLRRKYALLKKYLGDIIPQTRFVYGEVNHPTKIANGVELVDIPQKSVITLQRRIHGRDLQKIGKEENEENTENADRVFLNPVFLKELQKAHQKYILLKMFIASISRELGLPENTLDVKMDLGPLSDMDRFDIQHPTSIRKHLTSPNIMWDGKKISFVDMDTGDWNDAKEELYRYLMMPETLDRWGIILREFQKPGTVSKNINEMLGNMGLLDDYEVKTM